MFVYRLWSNNAGKSKPYKYTVAREYTIITQFSSSRRQNKTLRLRLGKNVFYLQNAFLRTSPNNVALKLII